ncbi:MAG: glutaredoxin family protein [Tissierellia bacterium]|nr:glutaredoxin family protein [Tissierellia bacterium]
MEKPIVYTSGECPYSLAVKEYLKNNHIDFEERNISLCPEGKRELMKLGYSLVPVVVYGDTIITGFEPEQLNELKIRVRKNG